MKGINIMNKKLIPLILTASLVMTALTGCNITIHVNEDNTESEIEETSEKNVEITISDGEEELAEARSELNEIDDQIVELFKRRMEISERIAEIKQANDMPILNQGREDEVIQRLTEGCDEDMAEYITELYKEIFEISRACQEKFMNQESK